MIGVISERWVEVQQGRETTQAMVTSLGRELLQRSPRLAGLLFEIPKVPSLVQILKGYAKSGSRGFVFKRGPFAVKHFYPDDPQQLTGTEQLQIMQAFQAEGALCAQPLAATKGILISAWVFGRAPRMLSADYISRFEPFLNQMENMAKSIRGRIPVSKSWEIDANTSNYRIVDNSTTDPMKKYIALDPAVVFRKSELR